MIYPQSQPKMSLSCSCFPTDSNSLLVLAIVIVHSLLISTSSSLPSSTSSSSSTESVTSFSSSSPTTVMTSSASSTDGIPSVSRDNGYDVPHLNRESYVIPGDIQIGALMGATEKPRKESGQLCTNETNSSGSWMLLFMEALVYAVQLVNADADILPNATLGLVVLDDCGTPSGTLAQSLSFVPRSPYATNPSYYDRGCNNSDQSSNGSPRTSLEASHPHYDVVGVIGPFGSELSLPTSYLYTAVKLPMLSYMATSDELSDAFHHRYFLRIVPPDKFQAHAMLQFIRDHGWSYISMLYQEGSYGERAFDSIREMAPSFNVCIATAHRMKGSRSDYRYIVNQLLKFPKARVVILFSADFEVRHVFREVQRQRAFGHFIWMGSDGMADKSVSFRDYMDVALGTITFTFLSKPIEDFFGYFGNLTVNSTSNPWFKPFWEAEHKCSFEDGTCDGSKSIDADKTMKYSHGTSLAIDSILTFARALDNLLRDVCPNARGKDARDCVEREMLLKYLLNTSFEGYTDVIQFDDKGDAIGKYQIKQIVLDIPGSNYSTKLVNDSYKGMIEVPIGIYGSADGQINYEGTPIIWEHLNLVENVLAIKYCRNGLQGVPESICSRPCLIGEYKIEKDVSCCWECRRCRDNEKLVDGNTSCQACPIFTWPDPSKGYITCIPIPLTYPAFTDTLPVIQVFLALFSIILTLLIFVAYVIYRNERVIKAASRELCFLQLVASFTGYCSVIICQSKPTEGSCAVLYFLFCLSFTCLYSPLLVKTIRVYRIFQSGSKNNQHPKFVSPQTQLLMSGILIGLEVLLSIIVMAVYKPTARRYQPVWSEKFVELACDLTLPGVVSFLAYNLVLVSLCSIFAFKTRKLPDNFNESRFISMCVTTTLIIWLAFVATFFTADRANVRILILSVALLLNHSVALLFLYLPKIYAVTCLPNEVQPAGTTGVLHTTHSRIS